MNKALLKGTERQPIPANEFERLEALRSYGILDTESESGFDNIAEIASMICDVPVALVAFLDTERNWFKAAVGVDISESPRHISFCQHTIMQRDVLEIGDAKKNELFDQSPLVHDNPEVQFYAGAPLIDQNGFPLGTVCVLDLRPRTLNEKQKKALAALAEEAMSQLHLRKLLQKEKELSRMTSSFISVASHQLRTPLAVVQSNFDLLMSFQSKKVTVTPEKLDRISTRINFEIDRMTQLIDGVMETGKSNNDGSGPSLEKVDLLVLARQIKDRLDQIQSDGRSLEVQVLGKPTACLVYAEKLNDILVNLLTNAFKYSPTAPPPVLTIDFRYTSHLLLQIKDFGIGIPEDELPMLFQPFYRASNASGIQGTGLGLNIVKKYIEDHFGDISVSSKPGDTTFTINMPYGTET